MRTPFFMGRVRAKCVGNLLFYFILRNFPEYERQINRIRIRAVTVTLLQKGNLSLGVRRKIPVQMFDSHLLVESKAEEQPGEAIPGPETANGKEREAAGETLAEMLAAVETRAQLGEEQKVLPELNLTQI